MTTNPPSPTPTVTARPPATHLLTRDRIAEVTRRIGDLTGLDPRGGQLLKFTNNAVVRLPAAGAVIRIAGSATVRARIPGVLAAAEWFTAHDLPTVRLWPDLDQPLHAGPYLATVWVDVPADGPPPAPQHLARILRALHAITNPPPPQIPVWAPTASIRTRLTEASDLDDDTRAFLTSETDAMDADLTRLAQLPPLIPPGVIHGDAHLGNLIPTPAGPVICDFDSTRVGPREWDLTPAAVGALRFDYTGNIHRDLASAYGADVTSWPGFPTLRRLRELQLVTSVLPTLAANPALRPQWEHRLATYRAHDDQARWTPYST